MASTFSYAQAAKGIATPTASSKPASGAVTPAKDAVASTAPASISSPRNWADDAESESFPDQATRASRPERSSSKPASRASHSVDTSTDSSPDLGASSSSTVTKDDDVSSIPNTSSESTWDNKSQASTSVDKSVEPVEKTSEKVKKGKNVVVKPLQDAPLPAVNFWKQRADELKAKAKATPPPTTNGVAQGQAAKKIEGVAQEKASNGDGKTLQARKDAKGEPDFKKGTKGRLSEKEAKPTPNAQPPPSTRDQESWPTPVTAIDEDRKKAQDKERKENPSAPTHGKHEWVKVPFNPTVVFNTPLPNAANARRGGRPATRGGPQAGGRSTNSASEKEGSVSDATSTGEQSRRERQDGTTLPEFSKSKRSGNTASPVAFKDQSPTANTELGTKINGENDSQPRRASLSSQVPGQNGSVPRQYPNRASKGRRGDFSAAGERRRDGEGSPTKDNTLEDRRVTTGTQTDSAGFSFQEAPNGHHSKQGRYNSYTGGRERGRGGGRGTRASYSNGHQFTNGHTPSVSSSTFPMGPRSPTTFTPENNNYFPVPQGKYGRGGHRSQSVTSDAYRFVPYQGGPQVAPLQTYGVYDYGAMQPMSAMPYTPFVDHFAMFSMITTQVEYYFSVDNLLKDMYLRRHMDSQGFVSLDFIAGFNRIKHLSTDLELLKLVCQQSNTVEYRACDDGVHRLRRRDGWNQWVLDMAERDKTAQNDGPKEHYSPKMPKPAVFDPNNHPQWSAIPNGVPAGMYEHNGSYPPQMNGYHGAPQDATDTTTNATAPEGHNGHPATNGHPAESSAA